MCDTLIFYNILSECQEGIFNFFPVILWRRERGIEPRTRRHWMGLGLSNPATFDFLSRPIASTRCQSYQRLILRDQFSRHIVSSIIHYIGNLSRGSLVFYGEFLFYFADWPKSLCCKDLRSAAGAFSLSPLAIRVYVDCGKREAGLFLRLTCGN